MAGAQMITASTSPAEQRIMELRKNASMADVQPFYMSRTGPVSSHGKEKVPAW